MCTAFVAFVADDARAAVSWKLDVWDGRTWGGRLCACDRSVVLYTKQRDRERERESQRSAGTDNNRGDEDVDNDHDDNEAPSTATTSARKSAHSCACARVENVQRPHKAHNTRIQHQQPAPHRDHHRRRGDDGGATSPRE